VFGSLVIPIDFHGKQSATCTNQFQGRIRGIPGSILRGNNTWSVYMPLLVGRKPVRK